MAGDGKQKHDVAEVGRVFHALRQTAFRSAIQQLQLPPGSQGLDAGCGPGFQTMMLAEAVGPGGHVTGIDLSSEALAHAEAMTRSAGLSNQTSFRKADLRALPVDDDSLAWAWSADCIGYAPMDPLPLLKELSRVVKPGGVVAILAWSHETLLPGYPKLEASSVIRSCGSS